MEFGLEEVYGDKATREWFRTANGAIVQLSFGDAGGILPLFGHEVGHAALQNADGRHLSLFRRTGCDEPVSNVIDSENALRFELNLPIRLTYGGPRPSPQLAQEIYNTSLSNWANNFLGGGARGSARASTILSSHAALP
jgi:hypothetical protein